MQIFHKVHTKHTVISSCWMQTQQPYSIFHTIILFLEVRYTEFCFHILPRLEKLLTLRPWSPRIAQITCISSLLVLCVSKTENVKGLLRYAPGRKKLVETNFHLFCALSNLCWVQETLLKLKDISDILIKEKLQRVNQLMGRQMCFRSEYTGENFPSTTRLCNNLTSICDEKFFIMI